MIVFHTALAQKVAPEATTKNDTKDLQLNATGNGPPILKQTSQKGIYDVELRWPQETLNSQSGIQMEIVFLDAKAPQTTSNSSSRPEATDATSLSTIEHTLAVDSYDIVIHDASGKLLWNKVNQPGLGCRGTQDVEFNSNYTGPVTIDITNIKPGWDTGSTPSSNLTDSVKFTATIVPEFPLAAVFVVMGAMIAIIVAAGRTGKFGRYYSQLD